VMALRRPVDAGVPLSPIGHPFLPFQPASHRDLGRSLYWRSERGHKSGADSPRGIDHGQSDGARVPPRWSDHRGPLVAPDESARFRKATPTCGVGRQVTLRSATLHFARPAGVHAKNRTKGYRGHDTGPNKGVLSTGERRRPRSSPERIDRGDAPWSKLGSDRPHVGPEPLSDRGSNFTGACRCPGKGPACRRWRAGKT
jgi:hypothetical protein